MAMKENELPLFFCVTSKLVQVESVWGQYFYLILFCYLFSFNYISMITFEIKF